MMEVCLVVGTAEIKKHLAARAEEVPWLRAALQACERLLAGPGQTLTAIAVSGPQITAACMKACPQQRAELKSPQLLQLSKVWRSAESDSLAASAVA